MNQEKAKIKQLIEDYLSNKIGKDDLDLFLKGFNQKAVEEEYDKVLHGYFNELTISEEENPEVKFPNPKLRNEAQKITASSINNKNRFINSWKVAYRMAASFILIGGFAYLYWNYSNENTGTEETAPVISMEERIIPPGKKGSFTLSDGSFIHMNADSRLSFPQQFKGENREVSMTGEAYFDIERDENRPFIINTNHIKIKVLGTSFNVKAYNGEDEVSVTVESGRVLVSEIAENPQQYELTVKQKIIYNTTTNTFRVITDDALADLDWRKGILKFNQTSFKEIEKTLERWYGVEFIVEDPSIYQKKVRGVHHNESLKAVLESLEFAFGIKYEIKDKTVKLKTR
ncbi:FecR family protein [Flexithrix dorotheae]|uniref:FecR family protein n=1 Tax=Flexithrix dorotheae TaxID=70993 RepID=UPI00037638C4|nr:FecR domain-containing protein [Flexithrix dorotheae]